MDYTIFHALLSLRPGAECVVVDNSLSGIDWHDSNQSQPSDEEISIEITRLTAAEPMRLLRIERDKSLHDCDWWASSDLEMSQDQIDYRQALRDLPANTDPADPTWPAQPLTYRR